MAMHFMPIPQQHLLISGTLTVSTNSGKRGPLERFTLMIGENILHFRIVKAPVEQSCLDEPRSTSSACRCPLCGKMLQDRSEWETHESEVHCLSKRYRCVTCNAHFGSKDSLVAHMRYHPGPRPHRCTVCTKSFRRSASLALHMKMHITGHRHFCQICGRWFKSLSSLTDHENTCLAMLTVTILTQIDRFGGSAHIVTKCSIIDEIRISMREFTQEKSHTHVDIVEEVSHSLRRSQYILGRIRVRSPTLVEFADRSFEIVLLYESTNIGMLRFLHQWFLHCMKIQLLRLK
ncbi:hypothetical protein KIN20_020916 [Parelaphostrongylus tenuis]|uniref:C2H2-type domain-containing protein n=1 Tax=Parelaphostrongylus tenuis TaxID=148309 RepID=A0AAD5N6I5_PARTN|nr:hypothetical protein KIN20_020916 [Parelaphostrongylus tenuis]